MAAHVANENILGVVEVFVVPIAVAAQDASVLEEEGAEENIEEAPNLSDLLLGWPAIV